LSEKRLNENFGKVNGNPRLSLETPITPNGIKEVLNAKNIYLKAGRAFSRVLITGISIGMQAKSFTIFTSESFSTGYLKL
jgi:hypothetical protein